MTGPPVFQALFGVINNASAPLHTIAGDYGKVGAAAEHAGRRSAAAAEHAHASTSRWRAGVHLFHHELGEAGVSIGETSSRIGELIPLMAGLGAAGGVSGLFEFTAHMAEARAETLRMLKVTQLTPQAFGMLSYAAAMTDTPIESVTKGAEKLNRVIADAASGKNKGAASLFRHLGISLKDASGHVITTAEALPRLMAGFRANTDEAMRTRMAFALFGKGGQEMLPILTATTNELEEWDAQAKRIRYPFSKKDNENLEGFNQAWKRGTMAVGAFNNELGAKLAPVLRPVIDDMEAWVTANRDWLSTDIAEGVRWAGDEARYLITEAKKLNWHAYGEDIRGVAEWANWAAQEFGGWNNVIEGMIALVVGRFALSFLAPLAPIVSLGAGVAKLAAGLVVEWGTVTAAAEAAAAAEATAAGGMGAGAGAAAKGMGLLGVGGLAAYGLNSAWNYLDPTDHMDRFLDQHLPGYSGADNFLSHVGMGTPYAQQGLAPPRLQRSTAEQLSIEEVQMQRLQAKGWSHENAAGIISNLDKESGLDPNAMGDNGNARGLAQWHGDRQRAIEMHFRKRLADMSVDDQVDAVDWELRHGSEQEAGRQIMAQRTAFDSGAAASHFYERPGDDASEAMDRGNMARGLMLLPPVTAIPAAAAPSDLDAAINRLRPPGSVPTPQLYGPRAVAPDVAGGAPGVDGQTHVKIEVGGLGQGGNAQVVSNTRSVVPTLNVGYGVGNDLTPERY